MATAAEPDLTASELRLRSLRPAPANRRRYLSMGRWKDRTVATCLAERAELEPDALVAIEGEAAVRVLSLYEQARGLAAALSAMGLQPGDVISVQLPNWREAFVINCAASLAGLVYNPIMPIYRDAEVEFMLRDSGSRLLFAPRAFRNYDFIEMAERIRPNLPRLREVVVVRSGPGPGTTIESLLERYSGAPLAFPTVDADAAKMLLYTSGTTGRPKGVIHSSNTLMAELEAVTSYWRVGREDVVLMPSPIAHVTGYLYGLELPIVAGCQSVLMERWDAAEACRLIERWGATLSVGATPFLQELVRAAAAADTTLPSLRIFACGGAPVPPELIHSARGVLSNCAASRVYGSTEAPTVTLGVSDRSLPSVAADTDGIIVGHEVRIQNQATGEAVAEGDEGEIAVRGPELFLGYLDPDDEADVFTSDGYFLTGDLGRRTLDNAIVVTGRKKDLIIRGGENISPKEIEDCLYSHPAIADVAVVAMPSPRLGESVCAFIVPAPGETVDLERVCSHLKQAGLARQKWPERVEVVGSLARTPSGKVRKDELRRAIADILKSCGADDPTA